MDLKHWTAEKFTQLCIFGGTDYKEPDVKIKGFALKKAFRVMKRFPSYEKMLPWLRTQEQWQEHFPCALDEYLHRFKKVLAVFFHHIAFDPRIGECVPISRAFPHAD